MIYIIYIYTKELPGQNWYNTGGKFFLWLTHEQTHTHTQTHKNYIHTHTNTQKWHKYTHTHKHTTTWLLLFLYNNKGSKQSTCQRNDYHRWWKELICEYTETSICILHWNYSGFNMTTAKKKKKKIPRTRLLRIRQLQVWCRIWWYLPFWPKHVDRKPWSYWALVPGLCYSPPLLLVAERKMMVFIYCTYSPFLEHTRAKTTHPDQR